MDTNHKKLVATIREGFLVDKSGREKSEKDSALCQEGINLQAVVRYCKIKRRGLTETITTVD